MRFVPRDWEQTRPYNFAKKKRILVKLGEQN